LRWLAFAPLLLFGAGCGGIHASKSVSPLDFLLPGIGGFMQVDPTPPPPPVEPESVQQVAQVR
jgi:hypothetical protein